MDDGNCKSSFAPPRRYSEWCHETGEQIGGRQFQRWAWSILAWKKIRTIFRPSGVPAIFRESDFYLNSLKCTANEFVHSLFSDSISMGLVNLEEPIRSPSPHRINFSVCLSVRLSTIYENTLHFHVGSKIRVSTWSFLSVIHPLQIPIPMYEEKVRVQQQNS